MTSDRRYFSGAISKAVTKRSCLLISDMALLLKRCETFRTNKCTHSYSAVKYSRIPLPSLSEFDKPDFSVYATHKSPRLANRQARRRSNLTSGVVTVTKTSCPVNCSVSTCTHDTYTSSAHKITPFDRTRPTIRTLCVASYWVMIEHRTDKLRGHDPVF